MSIALTGMASGMDTSGMIDKLMAAERIPRQKIAFQQLAAQGCADKLTAIQGKLVSLKMAVNKLSSSLTWQDTQAVTSTDDKKLSATRTGGVGPGTYTVVVEQMASAARRSFEFTGQSEAQTLSFTSGGQTHTVELDAGASIDDAVAKINSQPEVGLFAVNVSGRLVLAARTTGVGSDFTASGSSISEDTSQAVAGRDALFTIDGVAGSSATNIVTNAIPGLDLTLKGITDGVSVTVGGPAPDNAALKKTLQEFVTAYNDAVTAINTVYNEKKVLNPKNEFDIAKGVLGGDIGLGSLAGSMRRFVAEPIAGADPALKLLAQVGISTGASTASGSINADAVAGKLVFDEATFDKAIATDPLAVRKLFGDASNGFAKQFADTIDEYSSTSGVLAARIGQAKSSASSIQDSLIQFDRRLDMRQTRLERQFAAMEAALSRSQAISAQLMAAMQGLPQSQRQ